MAPVQRNFPSPRVQGLRGHLNLQAKLEPPWVDNCAMRIEKWRSLVNALNTLAVRSAALEGLLEVITRSHAKPDTHC